MYTTYNQKVVPTAPLYQPPMTQYPPTYNPNYTYAVQPQQVYYQYPQQPMYQQYPPQRQTSPVTAFVGGMVLGAVVEDILDPTE
jgi:hypothetical protein